MSEFDILFENETFGFSLSESTIRVSTVAIVQDISSPHLIMNHPELQVGAILVRVGDIKVRGLTLKQITPILKRASRPIVLRFDDSRRSTKSMNESVKPTSWKSSSKADIHEDESSPIRIQTSNTNVSAEVAKVSANQFSDTENESLMSTVSSLSKGDLLSRQYFETEYDSAISTSAAGLTRTLYDAKFASDWCSSRGWSCSQLNMKSRAKRRYFRVLENGYEENTPYYVLEISTVAALLCWPTTWIPDIRVSSTLLGGCCIYDPCLVDKVTRIYFDSGVYDTRHWARVMGYRRGQPRPYSGEVKHVCCYQDCPQWANESLSCYSPNACGERVRIVPYDTYCFVIPNYTTRWLNCGELCGRKTGEPVHVVTLVECLARGEAANVEQALQTSRDAWALRINL